MTSTSSSAGRHAPAWLTTVGIVTMLLSIFFVATEGNEVMRQVVLEVATPANLEMPPPNCPLDELEEEGLSLAECAQMVENVRSYVVSRPPWFATIQTLLSTWSVLLGFATFLAGAMLVNQRVHGVSMGLFALLGLLAIDVGHFLVAQHAGPIIRGIHLPSVLLWFSMHLALASAFLIARRDLAAPIVDDSAARAYWRFEIAGHWFTAAAVFFLFISSWWMLALPLPSAEFRYREFPFQLHKNIGITILLLMFVMAVVRLTKKRVEDAGVAALAWPRLRIAGHISLYVLVFAVCVTGYMSSSYSGWGTQWWWAIDLPYWGYEDDELNELYSDLHLYTCWALLVAMAAHIAAALLHAFSNDGFVRRIVRW